MLKIRDFTRLAGIHGDLLRVILLTANNGAEFMVLEGIRTLERQKELFAKRATRTLNSRHLTGHAVDIAPLDDLGAPSWHWPQYDILAVAVKLAATQLSIPVIWGGDWVNFRDGPHWELPWNKYPK